MYIVENLLKEIEHYGFDQNATSVLKNLLTVAENGYIFKHIKIKINLLRSTCL